MEKIIKHFKKADPTLYSVMVKIGILEKIEVRNPGEYFRSLCGEIVGQQLSGKAADTIFGRFERLFPKKKSPPNRS